VSVARKNLVLAAAATLVAAAVHAASIVPPENLGELARISDAVVLAQAGSSQVSQRGSLFFTLTSFRVLRPVAGPLEPGERFSIEAPGGEVRGIGWLVPGSPRFEPGQVYLLFLSQKPTGEWVPRMMAYGLLRRVHGRDGSSLLAPLPDQADIQPFVREDGILPEAIETYRETSLLPHLRAVAIGRDAWDSRRVLARSEQIPMEVFGQAPPTDVTCAFMSGGGYNLRWQRFDSGQTVTMSADSTGDSSISGGGFTQVQGALSGWNSVPSTSLNLLYGGQMSYTMTCTGNQDSPAYGVNIVMFNDPCNDLPDPACSQGGVLAFGGPWYSGTHSFDGTTWTTIMGWFVVVNNGSGSCFGASSYQLMIEHELGHGLGFNHVSDPSALMYYMCCNPMDNTDTKCAQYVYQPAGPTPTPTPTAQPTPTPTPPTSPPAAPTGVSASDGTWSDRVRILWNTSAGATSYHVYRNTTNDSNTATDLGYVTGTGADDMSAVAGTTYYYWVKAFNALGGSPFSSPDTGFRATGAAPTPTPTPVPSGPPVPTGVSASDGTYTDRVRITWNASAGATGYWIYRNTTASPPATEIAWVGSPGYDDGTATPGQTYWYWVRAGNASGWSAYSASDTGFRATTPVPTPTPTSPPGGLTASFAFAPGAPFAGTTVQFTDASSGATAWSWTFGDGSQSTVRNPSHTYAVRGTYTVTLRVSNGVGSSQTTKTITVGARARRHFSTR
jgi:hypothetical protein